MSALRVINAGFAPTIQDLGRPYVQNLGVPPSGALDPVALRIANALVGNPSDAAGLELRVMGPTLDVAAESVRVALVGTATPIDLLGDRPAAIPAHESVRLDRGHRFRIGGLSDTGVAYLAVEGGFDVPAVYDSRSTYVRARIGGVNGHAVADGDELPLALDAVPKGEERRCGDLSWREEAGPFRVVLGPQDDYIAERSIEAFFAADYMASREADRMGIRLDGPTLEHARGHDIVSDGIATGAIQVPGNGRPIVLLADHQTTGGYPKLGTVISADVPRLGRLRPGDTLRFERITIAKAELLRREMEQRVTKLIEWFEPAGAWLDEAALYRENLVSGVVGSADG